MLLPKKPCRIKKYHCRSTCKDYTKKVYAAALCGRNTRRRAKTKRTRRHRNKIAKRTFKLYAYKKYKLL